MLSTRGIWTEWKTDLIKLIQLQYLVFLKIKKVSGSYHYQRQKFN